MKEGINYQAYLLRLQRYHGRLEWIATLENIHTKQVFHFTFDQDLWAYLQQCYTMQPDPKTEVRNYLDSPDS